MFAFGFVAFVDVRACLLVCYCVLVVVCAVASRRVFVLVRCILPLVVVWLLVRNSWCTWFVALLFCFAPAVAMIVLLVFVDAFCCVWLAGPVGNDVVLVVLQRWCGRGLRSVC